MANHATDDELLDSYISTGHLPPRERVVELVAKAYDRYRANAEGTTRRSTLPWPAFQGKLAAEFNLDNINFSNNDQLTSWREATPASPEQVEEAVRINSEVA